MWEDIEATLSASPSAALASSSASLASGPQPWQVFGLVLVMIWVSVWKGLALWRAARKGDKFWFVVIFLVGNTYGLLEVAYYYYLSKYDWSALWRRLGITQLRDKLWAATKSPRDSQ